MMPKNTFPTIEIEISGGKFTFVAHAEVDPHTGEFRTTRCRKCGEEIFFAKTPKGKLMPVNLNSDGEIFTSHFASCPFAGEFRKNDSV